MATIEIQTESLFSQHRLSESTTGDSPGGNLSADRPLDSDFKHAAILMIDDEPINSKSVRKYLRSFGYQNFSYTSDSAAALEMIRDQQPDLVLLDIMMPQVNGLDLLRDMRADRRLQYLPVIILTAHCDPETKRQALEAGATDFLGKPIEPLELAPRVRNVLTTKWHQDQLARYVGQLEGEVRQQARELVISRHEAKLRYLAGKAEIATDVLHNVGNALNSVNVDVDLITRKVDELRLDPLKRASELLQQHSSNLAEFLTGDERGRALPTYFAELADALLAQRASVRTDIGLLAKHVEHINTIVATQQKYAKLRHFSEPVALADLLADAKELLARFIDEHAIQVVHHYGELPAVETDRQKLLQVLVNLLKNAVQAIAASSRPSDGRLLLRLRQPRPYWVCIEVIDNGVGIPKENLVKIFSHGFTTKPDGHGFGLHSCANIVRELGGTIYAHSDGSGTGAKFTVVLPVENAESEC